MRVLLPSSTLPQVMKRSRLLRSCCRRYCVMSVAIRSETWAMAWGARSRWKACGDGVSEVAFLLLLLHRGGCVVVDHAALALRCARQLDILADGRQGVVTRCCR